MDGETDKTDRQTGKIKKKAQIGLEEKCGEMLKNTVFPTARF